MTLGNGERQNTNKKQDFMKYDVRQANDDFD